MSLALVATCGVALAVSLVGEGTGRKPLRAVGKVAASLAFIALAVSLDVPAREPHGAAVIVALVLSAVGDVLLLSNERRWFLSGLVAFLFAHVAYAGAFVQLGPSWPATAAAGVALTGLAWVVWRWLSPHVGRMARPVLAYVVVITAMVALAAGVAGAGAPAGGLLLLAAVLFFVSDLFVARQRFVTQASINRYVGLPLYYGAQLLFAYAASLA